MLTIEYWYTYIFLGEQSGIQFAEADIQMIPQNYVSVSDEEAARVQRLVDMLEDNDDVQNVYTNVE